MDDGTRTQRSKMLSMWLRHKPERGGIALSPDGWTTIPDLLAAYQRADCEMTRGDLEHLIRLDAKSRFEMEGDRVRARYGHSLKLEEKPHPGMPPEILYHGTAQRYVAKIMETGLRPMKRQYVHLSPDRKTAREVGRRRDQEPAILEVSAHLAHKAGVQFYPRGKGIWLSDPIPSNFITVMESQPGRQSKPVESNLAARQSAPGDPRRRRPKGGFNKPG